MNLPIWGPIVAETPKIAMMMAIASVVGIDACLATQMSMRVPVSEETRLSPSSINGEVGPEAKRSRTNCLTLMLVPSISKSSILAFATGSIGYF